MTQQELYKRTMERMIIMHDRYEILCPDTKKKQLLYKYDFVRPQFMSFDTKRNAIYCDLHLVSEEQKPIKVARFRTHEGNYDVAEMEEGMKIFVQVANNILNNYKK